jgi:transcriptional regulator with XRE-family HTH domain
VAELRARGLTLAEIGRRLGLSRQLVHYYLRRAGVPPGRVACCRACRKAIAAGFRSLTDAVPAYCLDCLPADASFGVRLKACRLARGLSQRDLAARAGLPAAAPTAYELGRQEPRLGVLVRLARLVGPQLFPPGSSARPRKRVAPRSVTLPCRDCGGAVAAEHPNARRNGPVLCLACLARRPGAPFGERLKAHRLAAGLTLEALTARCGIRYQRLSAYECGAQEPAWGNLVRLVGALGRELLPDLAEGERAMGRPVGEKQRGATP